MVKKQQASKNFYSRIIELLKEGKRPFEIIKELNISKQSLNYYIKQLKAINAIIKLPDNTWEVKEINLEEVKKTTGTALNNLPQDSVRGHAFQFTYQLPENLKNWDKREDFLKNNNIKYENLYLGSKVVGQKLIFRDRKIWLYDKKIIINEKASFIAEEASKAQSQAINHFLILLHGLQNLLKANFLVSKMRCRVTNQHYALIKNALAKQYNDAGQQLHVYDEKGLWFIIDNSFKLDEAETIHPKTAVTDNKKVQEFFNGIKKYDGFTPEFIVNTLAKQTMNLDYHAENMASHVKAVQELAQGVKELRAEIKRFGGK